MYYSVLIIDLWTKPEAVQYTGRPVYWSKISTAYMPYDAHVPFTGDNNFEK